jgi:signal transduction histidine kinase
MHSRLTVGGRFLVIFFLAAILPLAVAGAWLVRHAGRAGEALLEQRMTVALHGLADEVGAEWLSARSQLLDLADSPELRARLHAVSRADGTPHLRPAERSLRAAAGAADPGTPVTPATPEISATPEIAAIAYRVHVRDAAGGLVLSQVSQAPRPGEGLRVELPIHAITGEREGVLEAWIRLETLLGQSSKWTARTGGVLGALAPDGMSSVLSTPFDSHLLMSARFELGGEEWITRRHVLHEPPAVLVLAAPLEPYRQPFREAARRGILLILAVACTGLATAALLTRQTTRPLVRLVSASRAMARGELRQRVPVRGPREVRELAGAFNEMAETLQRTLATLSKRQALAAVGEFAAVLAHEIRNPLTAIRIDLQRVEEVSHDEARRRALTDRMLESVRRLDRSVSGVLSVARSGRVEPQPIPLELPLAAALETARPAISATGAQLRESYSAASLPHVMGDRAALEQLLLNLLLNAVEALDGSSPQLVEVHVDTDAGFAVIRIRDSGRGIPADHHELIFEPLFSTKRGGTGLGLAIADRIARAHGGEIRVESEAGLGTTMAVHIPLATGPAEAEAALTVGTAAAPDEAAPRVPSFAGQQP